MSNHLPPHIIEKILLKLPVKAIMRCMLLQKSYYSLISSPKFIHAYTPQLTNHPSLFIGYADQRREIKYSLRYDDAVSSEYISPHFPFGAFASVVSYSDGLVCVFNFLLNKLILWNPCIQKFVALPDPNSIINGTCLFGLGFVNETNDYKVLMINNKREAEVYSLKHNSWKMISGTVSPPLPFSSRYYDNYPFYTGDFLQRKCSHKDSVSLKGSLYWLYKSNRKMCVGVYDFKDEVFSEISLPDDWGIVTQWPLNLMVYKESSIAVLWNRRTVVEIRVLDVDGKEKNWELISSAYPLTRRENWTVVGFKKSGEVIMEDDKLGIVSLCNTGLRTIINQQPLSRSSFVYNFVDTLALFGEAGDLSPITCPRVGTKRTLVLR